MNCFTGFIGLHGYNEDKATSGLFVDELPGMGEELLLAVSRHNGKLIPPEESGQTAEELEIKEVWERVEKRATVKLLDAIKTKANEVSNWNELLYQSPKPRLHRPLAYIAPAAHYTGQQLRLPDSKYASVYIKNIVVYSQTESTEKAFIVVDLYAGETLHTASKALKTGLNVIPVDYAASSAFGEGLIGVFTDTTDLTLAAFKEDSGCDCEGWAESHAVSLPLESLLTDEYTSALNDVTLFLDVEIRCNIEAYACENKNLFKSALWYLCGAELLAEKIHSPNVNWFVQSNIAATEELQKELYYEYARLIKAAVKAIPLDSLCISCAPDKSPVFIGSPMP